MPIRRSAPLVIQARGLVDSMIGGQDAPGGMATLTNLIPDPTTNGLWQCRPAATAVTTFPGFTDPAHINCLYAVGTRLYGLIDSNRNPGYAEPFVFDVATGAFVTVRGVIDATTCPASPPVTGPWVPPSMAQVGTKIMVAHPGATGLPSTRAGIVGNTNGTTTVVLTSSARTAGWVVGASISCATGDIPVGATISTISADGLTLTISAAATGSSSGTLVSTSGATAYKAFFYAFDTTDAANPVWMAQNTTVTALPSPPTVVQQFYNRAWFVCGNTLYYSDVLLPTTITNATQSLTVGDTTTILALAQQPLTGNAVAGIIQGLLAFKDFSIWQVLGDAASTTSPLTLNQLAPSIGCSAPRSVTPTPMGVWFLAADGVRSVQPDGSVSDPVKDVHSPFMGILAPSRAAASYNGGVYRLSCPSNVSTTSTADYWFDLTRQVWSGPHTVSYDVITPYETGFILGTHQAMGALWRSNVIRAPGDTFTEFGSALSYTWQTEPLPEVGGRMTEYAMVESIVDVALPPGGVNTVFTALDTTSQDPPSTGASAIWGTMTWGTATWGGSSAVTTSYTTIDAVSVVSSARSPVWGAFTWGSQFWGGASNTITPQNLNWTRPIVFKRMALRGAGSATAEFKIGPACLRWQGLGYKNTPG